MTGSNFWVGQVTENSIDDSEGILEDRYLGALNRSVNSIELGPKDVTGTLTYNAQDMRLVFFSIGSIYGVSGANGVNSEQTVTEINTNVQQNDFVSGTNQLDVPISFTLEDSKQSPGTGRNFVRTVKGIVPNTCTITAAQGEKVSVAIDYIAQNLEFSSGATTSITEMTRRPYLWSDSTLTLYDNAGNASGLNTVKSFDFEINQNRTGPHYLNGSRVIAAPYNGNRDYVLNVSMDLDGDDADMLYNFKQTGSKFNMLVDFNNDIEAVGSQHASFYLSGCWVNTMENPSTVEGTTESALEIHAGSLNALAWDSDNLSDGLYHFGVDW